MVKYFLTYNEVTEGDFSSGSQYDSPEDAHMNASEGQNLIKVELLGRYTQEFMPVQFNPVKVAKKRKARK